jgi:hypothetical protein
LIHFQKIVLAPTDVKSLIVDYRDTDGAEFAAFFVENQMARDAWLILNIGVVEFQSASADVLRRGRVLVCYVIACT